ncbi:MAG: CcdB-like protein [Sphingobium sp.]|nr:CcdB-like protein [Sphingobium sp.]
MAQSDVYILIDGGMVVDCQADHFGGIATRLVVPLEPVSRSHRQEPRLNPIFSVNGEDVMLMTQFATAIRAAELRQPIASLDHARLTIISAFDMLLTGV